MSEFIALGRHISVQKGKPPTASGYIGKGAEPYLNPEYLRGRAPAEFAKAGPDAVRAKDGDTILLWDGSNAGEFFKAKGGLVASTMARISPSKEFLPTYFYHVAKRAERYLRVQTNGTGIPHVDRELLESVHVFCPDTTQQHVVARILDTLDSAIRETEVVIAKLKAVKQGLLHDLLTRGIDANGELRPPQSEAPHLYKPSPLGCTPKDWRIRCLNEVCNRIGDGVHYAVPRCNEGVPFLFVSCIRNGRVNWADAAYVSRDTFRQISSRAMPRPGMVLYTVVGSYGYAAHVDDDRDFGFERNIAFLVPNEQLLDSQYLFHFLTSNIARSQVERLVIGNAQKVLTLSSLGSVVVPIPAVPEQIEVGRRLASITMREELEEVALKKLCSEKAGLLDDLLTGRVRVTPLLEPSTP